MIFISKLIKIICENCGQEDYHTPTQYKRAKHHFCCIKCGCEYRAKQHIETRECPICHNKFTTIKSDKKQFCSVKCQNKWQTTNIGRKNGKYRRVEVSCENCGKKFDARKYKVENGQHLFCCLQCRQQWYSEVWSQQEDWKDESRQRAVRILESGALGTNTKPQQITNQLLKDLHINYINEKNFKYYSADNYLTDYNLIIEVMGDFWHTNPLKFSTIKYNKQKQVMSRDKAKHTYMLKYHNINILYLWENDLYNNKDVCRMLIQEYVNNNGNLSNYHSFNYEIKSNKLFLKENLTIPFQDIKVNA